MPRSMGIFTRAGWPMIPYPVDHQNTPDERLRVELDFSQHLCNLRTAVREWLGLVAYRLTDKTSALFPGPGNEQRSHSSK